MSEPQNMPVTSETMSDDVVGAQHVTMQLAPAIKCLQCIGEYNQARTKGMPMPGINDAVTFAPSWQSYTFMGQLVIGCVAVPSCMEHLETKEKSDAQKASESGLILGGEG